MRISDLIERSVSESDHAGRGWVEVSLRVADALASEHGLQVEMVGPDVRGVCVKIGLRYMQILPVDGMPDDRAKVVCPTDVTIVDLCKTSHERLMLEAALRDHARRYAAALLEDRDAEIEIDPDLIAHEPADDVGEGLERVWYAGRRLPGYRCTLDAHTRQEWVKAFEEARIRHQAGGSPDDEDYLPYA